MTTGPNGRVCFAVAAPGTYTITEILQPGWTPTTPTNQTITVAAGQMVNLVFGNRDCVPAPAGMVAWWPLDEANGAATFAELQAGLNANIVPGPLGTAPAPNAMPGQVAGGAYFPVGSLGYGDVPSNPALDVAGTNFSIDAWVYPIGCGPQYVSPIVDKLRLGDPLSGYALGLLGGQLVLALGDPLAGGQLYTCTLPLPANSWNFVAASVDFGSGTVTFYVNATVQTLSSPAPAPKLPNTSSLWIGGSRLFLASPPSPHCEIGLDELEIFQRALSANELGQIFAAGPAGKCKPSCQAGYRCAPDKTVECGTQWTFNPPASTVPGCALQPLSLTTTTNALQPCGELIARTWAFVDCCGKTNSCTQTVTVLDTTPPLVNCPTNKTVECGAAWSFDPPTALDACCGTNVLITALATVTNTLGPCQTVIRQTWDIRDCCTNSVQCSQTVTVVDTTPPVITCPGPIK
ncbi:MAG TPA: HYR domain-containing protein, partial [Candidatus Paceibacterota bacterium]|nr:HYR domain-containing protein [Candidatus Paceibacterota bacterium]